jgi:hypothetical protein
MLRRGRYNVIIEPVVSRRLTPAARRCNSAMNGVVVPSPRTCLQDPNSPAAFVADAGTVRPQPSVRGGVQKLACLLPGAEKRATSVWPRTHYLYD